MSSLNLARHKRLDAILIDLALQLDHAGPDLGLIIVLGLVAVGNLCLDHAGLEQSDVLVVILAVADSRDSTSPECRRPCPSWRRSS